MRVARSFLAILSGTISGFAEPPHDRAFQIIGERVRDPFIFLGSDDHDYLWGSDNIVPLASELSTRAGAPKMLRQPGTPPSATRGSSRARATKPREPLRSSRAPIAEAGSDPAPTFLDITGAKYPAEYQGNKIHPLDGGSFLPVLVYESMEPAEWLSWHDANHAAARRSNCKALLPKGSNDWQLYDLSEDRSDPIEFTKLADGEALGRAGYHTMMAGTG